MGRASTIALTSGGGRRAQRKRITREELLAAGRELFGGKGLYESRIEDLSSRAGVAKGTLYGYFADKDELIQAVVAAGFNELLTAVRSETLRARTTRGATAHIVRAHLDFFARNPDLMRIFHQVRGMLLFDRRELRPLRSCLASYLADLADLMRVAAGSRSGARAPSGAKLEELAEFILGLTSGVTSVRSAMSPGRSGVRLSARMTRRLVESVQRAEKDLFESPKGPGPRSSYSRTAVRARKPTGGGVPQ